MEDGDTEKYRAQDFVFLSRKGGLYQVHFFAGI